MAMSLLPILLNANEGRFWGFEDARAAHHGLIWQADLGEATSSEYSRAVEAILKQFTDTTGKTLEPGTYRRAALKVYTNSGPGLQTPQALVRAVIEGLQRRGFELDEIVIIDARESLLRAAGYLPPLSRIHMEGPFFDGVRVYGLDEGELRSEAWFYESPLPREFTSPLGRMILQPEVATDPTESRRSYLPSKLLTEVDFWINLPVAVHHPATEMSGALLNASLWNITNHTRFLSSPANAPVAVAEISAIPEIQDTWALNIVSLESYQYIAGPAFNANYTDRLPQLWASVDPVILDVNLITLLNSSRAPRGFQPLSRIPEFVEFSVQLGLGFGHFSQTQTVKVAVP